MKPISKINTSMLDRSKTATRRIEKLLPILDDCFKNIVFADEDKHDVEIIKLLNDLVENEKNGRLSFEIAKF